MTGRSQEKTWRTTLTEKIWYKNEDNEGQKNVVINEEDKVEQRGLLVGAGKKSTARLKKTIGEHEHYDMRDKKFGRQGKKKDSYKQM